MNSGDSLYHFRVERPEPAMDGHLRMGGSSPDGRRIEANSRYLTVDGRPWLPVMGEFQFSRYPDAEWEVELLKMKSGGVAIVASYVFWIHHEEIEGEFDWSGQRDLRRFVELCAKHGLFAFPRIGPWCHGEVRNGGFPDWLMERCDARTLDTVYFAYVRRFYEQIHSQLDGLYFKDGGPIVGTQIENEFVACGGSGGEEHMMILKNMAVQAGIDVPLYTATGWGGSPIPQDEFLPVFGGYPDAFWLAHSEVHPPSMHYFFSHARDDSQIGSDLRPKAEAQQFGIDLSRYPYAMCEMGGGMQVSYRRRVRIYPNDVAALALTKIGSGANVIGYYVYHGGSNPKGKLTTLQESGGNDMPVVSYDFGAPIGEYGRTRSDYGRLRALHLFLEDFGESIAPMVSVLPDETPNGLDDVHTLRCSVRSDGRSGFLFVNNHQHIHHMPAKAGVQWQIRLPGETLTIPRRPVTVDAGRFFIWPFNLDLSGVMLKHATAQPVCTVSDGDARHYFFAASGADEVEYVFDSSTVGDIQCTGSVDTSEGVMVVSGLKPGLGCMVRLVSSRQDEVHIHTISEAIAQAMSKAMIDGEEHIFISEADLLVDGDGIHLQSRNPAELSFAVFPDLERASDDNEQAAAASSQVTFTPYATCPREPKDVVVSLEKVRDAAPAPPLRYSSGMLVSPVDEDFDGAATWEVVLPKGSFDGVEDMFLRVDYIGDVARLYLNEQLIADNFYNGTVWEIGLKRFLPEVLDGPLVLKIMPLREDTPIYLPDGARPSFEKDSEIAKIARVEAAPLYSSHMQGAGSLRSVVTSLSKD